MRLSLVFLAGALAVGATASSASPLGSGAASLTAHPLVQTVHHRPGHYGGPPWTRGRGMDRDEWLEGRRYGYGYPPRRTVCTTRYRSQYDPFSGAYVRRPERVCSERFGYGY